MLGSITQVLGVVLRHAEHADTRQDIQREDKVLERREQKSGEEHHYADEITDIAEVSVNALIAFLENELASYLHIETAAPDIVNPNTANAAVINPAMAQAARAYGGNVVAQAPVSPALLPPVAAEDSAPGDAPENGLDEDGQKILYRYLQDLKTLRDRMVETLQMRRSGTFLESLAAAIAEALEQSAA